MENLSGSFKFYWKLENFCFCDFYCNQRLCSPSFKINVPYKSEWFLYMFPKGYGDDNNIGIYLERGENDLGPKKITVGFRIYLIDSTKAYCPIVDYSENIFTKGCEWGENSYIKQHALISGSHYLIEDTLTILCDFTIIHPTSIHVAARCRRPGRQLQKFEEIQKICDKLRSLCGDGQFSDITLHGDPKKFSLHKCILKFRLPTLLRKLEEEPEAVHGNDLLTEQILIYAYTGKLNIKDFHIAEAGKKLREYGLADLENRIFSHSNACIVKTYFGINSRTFSWTIQASKLSEEDDIISPLISNDSNGIDFIVFLRKEEDHFWYINIKVHSKDDAFVRCKISLYDSNFNEIHDNLYVYNNNTHRCNTSIQLENGFLKFDEMPVLCFLKDFTLDFAFTYSSGNEISSINYFSSDVSFASYIIDDSEILLMDLEALYRAQYEVDTLIKAGNKNFKVHKCILSSRSPVFYAMLVHSFVEKENNLITIMKNDISDDDILAEIVDSLLLYTYCGKLEASDEGMKEHVHGFIDMYDIGGDYENVRIIKAVSS